MSFREIRDTVEILRALRYPRLVSMENFRYPNFALMAEILEWVAKTFDPGARIPKNIDTEADRVIFIKTTVLLLIQKAKVKLNSKNLYQSDGHSVRELLPVLRMLYANYKLKFQAPESSTESGDPGAVQISELRTNINEKRKDLKKALELAGKLPKTGANIYELMTEEIQAKEVRTKALSQSLNANEVEAVIRERIRQTEEKTADLLARLSQADQDEQDLRKKIDRRRRELEQHQKRLASLELSVSPNMEEFERNRSELKKFYDVYVLLFRNLDYLQQQLWQVERTERERSVNAEQAIRSVIEQSRKESEAMPTVIAGLLEENANKGPDFGVESKEVRVYGNMTGAGISDDEDEDENVIDEEDEEIERILEEEGEEEEKELALQDDNNDLVARSHIKEEGNNNNSVEVEEEEPYEEGSGELHENSEDDF